MGIASRIINILVLVAAVAAVVFTLLLFNKRTQITDARDLIADKIVTVTKKLDPSVKIAKDEMLISKTSDELKTPLKKLDDATEKLIKQREEIASAFATVANAVIEPKVAVTGSEIAKYETTTAAIAKIKKGIDDKLKYYNGRNNAAAGGMQNVATLLQGTIDKQSVISEMKVSSNSKMNEAFGKIGKSASDMKAKKDILQDHIGSMYARIYPNEPKVNLDDLSYKDHLNMQLDKVKDFVEKHNEIVNERDELKKRVTEAEKLSSNAEETVREYRKKAEDSTKKLKLAQSEIKRLKDIINPGGADSTQIKNDTPLSLLKLVTGKITYVNHTLGFVVINIGANAIAKTMNDGTIQEVKAPIPVEAHMTITNSLDPIKAKYIGKIQVVKVEKDASVANILPFPSGMPAPKIGDTVFFSDSDLAIMETERKALREKQREQEAIRKQQESKEMLDIFGVEEKEKSEEDSEDEESEEEAETAKPAASDKKAKPSKAKDDEDEEDEE